MISRFHSHPCISEIRARVRARARARFNNAKEASVLSQKYACTALLFLHWDVIGDSHRFPLPESMVSVVGKSVAVPNYEANLCITISGTGH